MRRQRRAGGLLTLWLSLVLCATATAAAPPYGAGVVRIAFRSRDELAALAAGLDVWEVDHAAGEVVARVSATERRSLAARGYTVTDAADTRAALAIPDYACYRTIAEIEAQLDTWARAYPALVRRTTIGTSYEGRPLQLLHLTNHAGTTGTAKPVFFLMANIHGRELITPETALAFTERLLRDYGTDPDVTWLLDEHAIYVLISANPDGHVRNESGEPWSYWRKNAHPTHGTCAAAGGTFGVDLNRNFSFMWDGASPDPCAETYQGSVAASEPETQAVQAVLRALFADQRGPAEADAAADATTGLMVTLHSYGNLVLWPWGHTYTDAPNGEQLATLGTALAGYTGYQAVQSSDFYPTTGATDDWLYGELGVAAYTIEIGGPSDGFYPPCFRYDDLVAPNVSALLYAAKVARTPYQTAPGPDVHGVQIQPAAVAPGAPIEIAAVADDHHHGTQVIAAVAAYVGTPPWRGGIPLPLAPADGAFDAPSEAAQGTASSSGLPEGRHLIYVQGMDAAGNWGAVTAAFVVVGDAERQPPTGGTAYLPLVVRAAAGR